MTIFGRYIIRKFLEFQEGITKILVFENFRVFVKCGGFTKVCGIGVFKCVHLQRVSRNFWASAFLICGNGVKIFHRFFLLPKNSVGESFGVLQILIFSQENGEGLREKVPFRKVDDSKGAQASH